MERIKLTLPESKIFEFSQTIPISYINYGGHLGNDRVLSLCHDARAQFFLDANHSETDFFGNGLIMTESIVQYLNEGFFGDDLLNTVYLGSLGVSGFELYHSLIRRSDQKPLSRVKTNLFLFDYERRKVVALSHEIQDFFANCCGG